MSRKSRRSRSVRDPEPFLNGQELRVDSTAARRVVYDPPTLRLFVEFNNSGHSLYCYNDVDEAYFRELLKVPSVGAVLNGLRHRFQAERVSAFPEGPVTVVHPARAGRGRRDYTAEWLAVLAAVISARKIDEEYLRLLQNALTDLPLADQVQPPYFPPPQRLNQTHTDHPSEPIRVARGGSNMFDSLESDDEEDDGVVDTSSIQPGRDTAKDPDAPSMQIRYLSCEISCGIADAMSSRAFQMNRQKPEAPALVISWYAEIAHSWELTYAYLNDTLPDIDPWYAVLLSHELAIEAGHASAETLLPDSHNFVQLKDMLYRVNIVRDDTEYYRQKSIDYLARRLRYIEEKLDPLLVERDAVKAKMGVHKWTHNPEPKMTYAEKRKMWEEERDALKRAILIVESLSLYIADI